MLSKPTLLKQVNVKEEYKLKQNEAMTSELHMFYDQFRN